MKKRVLSFLLAFVMVLSCALQILPVQTVRAVAADPVVVTDPGTADGWEEIMGTDADGSRYAGRVWVDKSVYADGDTVTLNQQGNADSTFVADVDTDNGEYFQVVFSALGSSMSTNTSTYATRPLDVVLVLDTSTSMRESSSNKTRFQHMIEAANKLLDDLLAMGDVRVAIVSFNADSETILDLAKYNNGINLSVNNYTNTNGGGVITARDDNGTQLGKDSGFTAGTNLQDGIDRGMNILANATGTEGRTPVAIVLADGRANRAVNDDWYTINSRNRQSSGDAGIILSTLLNAAYGRARVENNYNTDMTVYGIGIDLAPTSNDYIFLNPGAEGSSGFNASNGDNDVETAWDAFVTWRAGNTATIQTGNGWWGDTTWTFDHNWPNSAGVTTAQIAENINYVDDYQDVKGAELGDAFDSIYQELATGAFNPITDTNNGATGVENTPLIYSDHIGQYMQVKSVQAIQVFGTVYEVTENNGVYTVAAGSGVNPTTEENWNTGDIQINVMENTDGTQELRIYIHQEILPILLDEITVTTEGDVTTRTLETTEYPPLRVFYTLGIDEDVLLPNGQVDITKIDPDYAYVNEDGTVTFYANAFNEMNSEDSDDNGLVDRGDAHVGFVPSHANRFYYHQAHQEIFISATNKDGSPIDWDDDMYGVVWDEDKYKLEALTYADYDDISDSDRVYTYVTFHRPTGSGNAAEQVTYLVYTTWGDLKSAATLYDKVNEAALNGGAAIDTDQVDSVVRAYKSGKNITNDDLIAVLGIQSRRVSRLHNMFEYKDDNDTQTADLAYAPAYNDGANDNSDVHEHSEVIVWLGNNGKLSLPIGTGLKVTKEVTEVAEDASADEKFAISVLLDTDSASGLTFVDGQGNAITPAVSAQESKTLVTVELADGESAYILGLPGGMDYTVTEADNENYTYTYTGDTKTVAGAITAGIVTNEPVRAGALYITKEVEHAHQSESFPTDQEFTFHVTFVDKDGQPIKNTEFELENNYDPDIQARSTDENGVMTGWLRHGETVHILGIPVGATVTVEEVQIPENYTSTTYRSRNHSGAEADNDGVVTIDPGQNATVVVTNTYTPDEVSVDISFDGTKNFDATNMTEESKFTFKLQEYVAGEWSDVEGEVVTITGGANASESFAFDALHLEFDKAGIHSYQIVEVLGNNSDITYDRSVYTFSVNATVDSNGDLQVEVVGYNQKEGFFEVSGDAANGYLVTTVFNNQYHTTATSVEVVKSVDDNAGTGKTAAGFVIETYEASVDGEGNWTQGDFIRSTVTDAEGEALLVRNYDNTDFEVNDADGDNVVTYHFIIKEKDAGAAGWTYDTTEYRLTVVLTKDDAGVITADFSAAKVDADNNVTDLNVSGDTAKITFANKYDPTDAKVSLSTLVKKELEGRALKDLEFVFAIYKNGETTNPVATGTNTANGTVTFEPGELTFSKVGKYEYDIAEIKNDLGGVTYDSIIYDLVVEVVDNGDGTLKATYYFEDSVDSTVTFKNTYTVKGTEVVIDGIKTLSVVNGSKALAAGDYTFYLYDKDDNRLDETTNLANGTFKFDTISYTGADIGKTFTYTVKEKNAGSTIDGVTYSNKEFTVTVKIIDNGDGTIKAEVNGRDNIHFENKYESKLADMTLSGKKNLEGRDLTQGEFTFALYQTDRNFANPVLVDDTITHDAEGNFTVSIEDLNVGTYYYVLRELIPEEREPGIHYSGAQFNITVTVTDSGNGQMTASKTVVNPGEEGSNDIVFNNLYRADPDQIGLSGTKTYNGGKALEDDVFSVGLYDTEGELLQTAFVKADGSFTFEDLVYTAADVGQTYTYTVEEIIPDGAADNGDGTMTSGNNIYDASMLTVTVTVKDDVKDGVLEITKTVTKNGAAAELSFTNTFIPDPITHVITAKKTYEKGLQGEDFRFTLTSADDKTDVDETVKNDAEGIVEFSPVTLSAVGEYKFTVVEKTDGLLAFIRPSEAEYEVTLVVENVNGVLVVTDTVVVNTKNTNESNLEFVNTYVIDGEDQITLRGTKALTGDRTTVEAEEFWFGLYDAVGTEIEKVPVKAGGSFQFSTLTFDETDVPVNGSKEITYTVKEIPGTDPLITYDEKEYTVVVTVKDNDQGGVTASYTVDGDAEGEIVFTNTYTAPEPVQAVINILKTVTNKTNEGIGPEDFTFILAADGQTVATDVSDEEGNAGFVITFGIEHLGQTFEYTLSEEKGTKKGVTYDKTVYDVKITVAQNEDGSLKTIINEVETDSVSYEFNNSYKKPGVPDTGDEAKLLLLGLLAVVGITGLCATAMFAFRKKEER